MIAAVALAVVLVRGGDEEAAKEGAATGSAPASTSTAPPETWEQLVRRDPDDPMALGDVDAPVVMIAYSEFQCPFCGKFARDTEPALVEKYVEDGTLRIEWRDFPYLGPESSLAAQGGRAAAAQDRFWEFEEAMYADQLPPNSGRLDEGHLVSVAEKIGLDVDRFREDLASPDVERAVEEDFAEGQAIGVTGTPAFVVNGVPVIGAQPTEVFEQTIEKAAEDAGS
ncbi:DsbA family protein [Nocardioides terrigena]|uniref:DsbA family protein n=1 Tax=Nocardioides terrigena TaxID=424797 RepID=UPI001F34ABC5|nr:thioredoxin domain-containing protein [Nocardioides terrigena]